MIKAAATAAALLVALLALLMLSSTMTASNMPVVVHNMNRLDTVPQELRSIITQRAEASGIPVSELAAYLALRWGYEFPIPSRIDLIPPGGPIMNGMTEDAMRAMVHTQWMYLAEQWLGQHLAELGTTDLRSLIPSAHQARYDELVEVLAEVEQLRSEDPAAWMAMSEGESYHQILSLTDWPFRFPVEGAEYTNDWGQPRPQNEGRAPTRHQGTDLFAPRGRPVLAVCDCQIKSTGWDWLGGWTVMLRDELIGVDFYYAHLEGYAQGIQAGKQVTKGTVLGYVGTSGEGPQGTHNRIQQPHLHFGIYTDRGAVNPFPYLVGWN